MKIKIFCSFGLHRYTHIVEEMTYISRMEFCAVGYQSFYKVCHCGYRKEAEGYDYIGLPMVAAPVYSYLTP